MKPSKQEKKKKHSSKKSRFWMMLSVYMIAGIFPGAIISMIVSVQPLNTDNTIKVIAVFIVFFPFCVLAMCLVRFIKSVALAKKRIYLTSGRALLMLSAIVTLVYFVALDRYYDNFPENCCFVSLEQSSIYFSLTIFTAWLSGYSSGLPVFLLRTYQIADKSFSKSKNILSQTFK